jgi:hypothetical protein
MEEVRNPINSVQYKKYISAASDSKVRNSLQGYICTVLLPLHLEFMKIEDTYSASEMKERKSDGQVDIFFSLYMVYKPQNFRG